MESKQNPNISWKASSMVLVYHGPDAVEPLARNDLPLNRLSEMEACAKMTKYRLDNEHDQAYKLRLELC